MVERLDIGAFQVGPTGSAGATEANQSNRRCWSYRKRWRDRRDGSHRSNRRCWSYRKRWRDRRDGSHRSNRRCWSYGRQGRTRTRRRRSASRCRRAARPCKLRSRWRRRSRLVRFSSSVREGTSQRAPSRRVSLGAFDDRLDGRVAQEQRSARQRGERCHDSERGARWTRWRAGCDGSRRSYGGHRSYRRNRSRRRPPGAAGAHGATGATGATGQDTVHGPGHRRYDGRGCRRHASGRQQLVDGAGSSPLRRPRWDRGRPRRLLHRRRLSLEAPAYGSPACSGNPASGVTILSGAEVSPAGDRTDRRGRGHRGYSATGAAGAGGRRSSRRNRSRRSYEGPPELQAQPEPPELRGPPGAPQAQPEPPELRGPPELAGPLPGRNSFTTSSAGTQPRAASRSSSAPNAWMVAGAVVYVE